MEPSRDLDSGIYGIICEANGTICRAAPIRHSSQAFSHDEMISDVPLSVLEKVDGSDYWSSGLMLFKREFEYAKKKRQAR
jgi:hypothetical protein